MGRFFLSLCTTFCLFQSFSWAEGGLSTAESSTGTKFPTIKSLCGGDLTPEEIRAKVLAFLNHGITKAKTRVIPGEPRLEVIPLKGSSILNNYAAYLKKKYSARLTVDPGVCGSAGADLKNMEIPSLNITAADMAFLKDHGPNFFSTLKHEESHIAHFDPSFGISPDSPFLSAISSITWKGQRTILGLPPYSSFFKADEISSYILELGWSYSKAGQKFPESLHADSRQASWMMLRQLSSSYCKEIQTLRKIQWPLLGLQEIVEARREDNVFALRSERTDAGEVILLLSKLPVRGSREIIAASLIRDHTIQLTFPLFSRPSLLLESIHDSNPTGGFQDPPSSFSAELKAVIGDVERILRHADKMCTDLQTVLAEVPDRTVGSGLFQFQSIEGTEPELKAVTPKLLSIRSRAINPY